MAQPLLPSPQASQPISTFADVDWSTGTESVINQILKGDGLHRVRIVSQGTPMGGSILDTERGSRGRVHRIPGLGQLPFSSTPAEENAPAGNVESLQCSVILEPTSLGFRFVQNLYGVLIYLLHKRGQPGEDVCDNH